MSGSASVWPELPVAQWVDTRDTLQLMTQVVGKIRLASSPLINHWWGVALYVTTRGLTTLTDGGRGRTFADRLRLRRSRAAHRHLRRRTALICALKALRWRTSTTRSMGALDELGIDVGIWTSRSRCPRPSRSKPTSSMQPTTQMRRIATGGRWCRPTGCSRQFRAGFIGKVSPVHFFWGGSIWPSPASRDDAHRAPWRRAACPIA